jgi:hypothetical protein
VLDTFPMTKEGGGIMYFQSVTSENDLAVDDCSFNKVKCGQIWSGVCGLCGVCGVCGVVGGGDLRLQ